MTRRSNDAGFALIEIVVALALLAMTLTGVAQLIVLGTSSAAAARTGALTVTLAADKMEQLQALAWGYDAEGREATDLTSDVSRVPAAEGGQGLRASPAGSLESNVAGYVDHVDGTGQWLGNETAPPPGTRFTRRWSVEPLPESPSEALVLRVVVFEAADASRLTSAAARDGSAWQHLATFHGAHLTLLRARRAQ